VAATGALRTSLLDSDWRLAAAAFLWCVSCMIQLVLVALWGGCSQLRVKQNQSLGNSSPDH
jgi:hypothetical protein